MKDLCKELSIEMNEGFSKVSTEELWKTLRSVIEAEGYTFDLKWDELFYSSREGFWNFIAEKEGSVVIFRNFYREKTGFTFFSYEIYKIKDEGDNEKI